MVVLCEHGAGRHVCIYFKLSQRYDSRNFKVCRREIILCLIIIIIIIFK